MAKMRCFMAILIVVTLAGCASTPIVTDLTTVAANPLPFKNQRVELAAYVIENPAPTGDKYRTWTFTIGSASTGRIIASEEGYNPSTIDKAYHLVDEAFRASEPVTVTGKLRVGPYREIAAGMEIDLDSVSYKGTVINTDEGPFVQDYYYYPYYGPLFWDPWFPHHLHHHW
jgi:hypothetical protein